MRERRFSARDADERLAWLIVVATIPVGITGLALEHVFRTVFAKPVAASAFLFINGLVLLAGERLRRRTETAAAVAVPLARARARRRRRRVAAAERPPAATAAAPRRPAAARAPRRRSPTAVASDRRIAGLSTRDGLLVGLLQVSALLPGISRSGVTMVGGLWRGLSHEDAARFAFLLATPVILAAGVLKLPSLLGPAGDQIRGQVVVGLDRLRDHRLLLRAVPRALVRDAHADAVRRLLPRRGRGEPRPLRRVAVPAVVTARPLPGRSTPPPARPRGTSAPRRATGRSPRPG